MRSSGFLASRLLAGMNYLVWNPDRRNGWIPYFDSALTGCPAYYEHSQWDLCDVGWRCVEAWHMIRRATGDPICDEEHQLRRAVFGSIREDALSYRPLEEWSAAEAWVWDQGRALLALCTLAEGGDETDRTISVAGRLLRGLEQIALKDGDALWYPAENWDGKQWGSSVFAHPPTGLQLEGAVRYYALTGDQWALDYAERVAQGVLSRKPAILTLDGEFERCGGGLNLWYTHVHARLFILYGLHLLGKMTGNKSYIEYAERGYRKVLSVSTSFGWVPESMERLNDGIYALDEVCCAMDVVKYALDRAASGETEWYDVVERYVANGIAAHQLIDYRRIERYLDFSPAPPHTRQRSYENIYERCKGSFTGSSVAYQFWRQDTFDTPAPYPNIVPSGCCSPSGIICFGLALTNALEESGTVASIHMHFPVEGNLIDVEEASLAGSRLRVNIKKPVSELRIRIHQWADRDTISASAPFMFDGDYLVIQHPSGTVAVDYDGVQREVSEPWCGGELISKWTGNMVDEVVSDNPVTIPLFPVE